MVGSLIGALLVASCATDHTDPESSPSSRVPTTTVVATRPQPTISTPLPTPTATGPTASSSVATTTSVTPSPATSTGPGPEGPANSDPASGETMDEPPVGVDGPEPDAGTAGDPVGESESDEPTFDIGPPVEIDVDLARFPVDDAGQGGVAPTGAGSDGSGMPADPDPADDRGATEREPTGWAGVDRALESALIRPGNTAASVAVSIDGDIVHAAAFGVRDPATGEATDTDDRFRIASISKPITAIVAMSLVEEGSVGLDEPVGGLIADHIGGVAASSAASGLTLRQLLTHRSGFGKYDSAFFRRGAGDCVGAARIGLARAAGGGGYTYSNMNYCLAGLLIEAVTGLTYEQAAYRYLLTPLGISGMRLAPTVDPGPDEVQHRTTPGRNYMETLGAAGAWIATPSDLVTILDALDLSTPGFKPLDQATVFEMVVPAGGQYGQRGYGLGVISYGQGRFGHTGTIESTHAMLLNRGDGVTWAITVAGQSPGESTDLERIMNQAFAAGGFVDG